jgi:hypothetical protein
MYICTIIPSPSRVTCEKQDCIGWLEGKPSGPGWRDVGRISRGQEEIDGGLELFAAPRPPRSGVRRGGLKRFVTDPSQKVTYLSAHQSLPPLHSLDGHASRWTWFGSLARIASRVGYLMAPRRTKRTRRGKEWVFAAHQARRSGCLPKRSAETTWVANGLA